MKFSYVLLVALFITSCNDGIKLAPNPIDQEITNDINEDESETETEEASDCLKNLKAECMVGKWKIKSLKLHEVGKSPKKLKLTEEQKKQYIEIIGNKISGQMLLIKENDLALSDDPIKFNDLDYTLFEDKSEKKIRFQVNQTKIESTIKKINNHVLTLVRGGKTTSQNYIIETVWTK